MSQEELDDCYGQGVCIPSPTPAPAPMTAEDLRVLGMKFAGGALTIPETADLFRHIDALTARVAELERERDTWQAEMDEKISEAEEAAEQHREWPAWAKGILKDLTGLGYQYDAGEDIDLRGDFIDHVNEWMRGIERDWKDRALKAESELAEARKELKATGERELTIEAIQRLFRYDPASGEVFYRVSCGSQQAGDRAGSVVSEGYRMVRFYGRRHPETHIIWVLMTGAWPINSIDHIDRNVQNNRWSNLREATPDQQTANQKLRVDNKSGTRGVHWHKKARRWVASMRVKGKRIHLGSFLHKEEAEAAYHAAARARWSEYYHPAKAER